MFTLDQIKTAHSKVKSGADFPNYIQDLITIGVMSYQTYVADGHTDFFGQDGFTITSPPKYENLHIADQSNAAQFKLDLKAHQQGKTDFITFCSDCSKSGVQKWVVMIDKRTCTYYDKDGNEMLEEVIPG